MHPGFFGWWKRGSCAPHGHEHAHDGWEGSGCGPYRGGPPRWGESGRWGEGRHAGHHDDDGAGFGVRRPLRFLAWKLELEEAQVGKLAGILDELKIERAQAAVDHRRSVGSFAEALEGEAFDADKARAAGATRVASAERLREAVLKALEKIHAILDAEQRKRLAYLLRTGALSI
jgi:Spy/CpxP family protein refolding chaperone